MTWDGEDSRCFENLHEGDEVTDRVTGPILIVLKGGPKDSTGTFNSETEVRTRGR